MGNPRIAVIHATQVSLQPIATAFSDGWQEADVCNILDEGLSKDRAREVRLTSALDARIVRLAEYAEFSNSDAVLYACSAFGPAIESAAERVTIPVLKPNDAMFHAAVGCGQNIALLVTFEPAAETMAAEFAALASQANSAPSLTVHYVPDALDALRQGDEYLHNSLIADAASHLTAYSAIMLGQFSMTSALTACREATDAPVFTSPDAAVKQLRAMFA